MLLIDACFITSRRGIFANLLVPLFCTIVAGDAAPQALRLLPPRPPAEGAVHLFVANDDQSALSSNRAPQIDILVTTNLADHLSDWLTLNEPRALTNGMLRLDYHLASAAEPPRYFVDQRCYSFVQAYDFLLILSPLNTYGVFFITVPWNFSYNLLKYNSIHLAGE